MHQLMLPGIGLLLSIAGYQIYRDIRRVKTWQAPANEPPPGIAENLQSFDCEVSQPIEPCLDLASQATGLDPLLVDPKMIVSTARGLGSILENLGHFLHIN